MILVFCRFFAEEGERSHEHRPAEGALKEWKEWN